MKYTMNEELVILRALMLLRAANEPPQDIYDRVLFTDVPFNQQIRDNIAEILETGK